MRFLKALFWIFVGVAVALFIFANKDEEVTVTLWRDVAWIMKLPTLVFAVFLVTFLPTFLIGRAKIWQLRRRLDTQPQVNVANMPEPVRPPRPVRPDTVAEMEPPPA